MYRTNGIEFDGLTADPITPPDGCVWYRGDLKEFRQRVNGVTKTISNNLLISLDFGYGGIYANSTTSYLAIPLEVLIPKIASVLAGATKVEVKICVSYETTGASTALMMLYNYTDGVDITASETAIANDSWVYMESDWIDITAFEQKAIRLLTKRVGGTGGDSIRIEACNLLLKYS